MKPHRTGVTPRCDSVRLTGKASFLLLPLTNAKANTTQVVIPTDDGGFSRMTVIMKPSQWRIEDFMPDPTWQCVLAQQGQLDQPFAFKDVTDSEYHWVGELKTEIAQSIAQMIAERMSRLPQNRSERLRRSEGFGPR